MRVVKRILVACGTGIATSTMVADKVAEACRSAGIQADITQCKAIEVPSYAGQGVDLIVTTTPVSPKTKVPVVNALPYLTGIGADEVSKQIIEKLRHS
ncbi:MAG: PTS sugar transporter subunit IIB [Firmicutes bacterium]|nr:PTS sugar transporter subunit IIB [Bacillota bacterium]